MDIVKREAFEKYAKGKTPAQFAMTTKYEVFRAGYHAAIESALVKELVEALEPFAIDF